jgi:hypothetical protein
MLLLVLLAEKHAFVPLAKDRSDEILLRGLSRVSSQKRKNLCMGICTAEVCPNRTLQMGPDSMRALTGRIDRGPER